MPTTELNLVALPNIPVIQPGDDLPVIILAALERANLKLTAGDVLIVSSKIVSKSQNRFVDLREITPSAEALSLGEKTLKDPRMVEVALRESVGVSRAAPNVLIVRHRLGFTSANAGIDQSNTGSLGHDLILLLPENPDESAEQLARSLEQKTGVCPGVVISDTHGRPFRMGNVNVAIGVSGIPSLLDQRGYHDLFGRELKATVTAFADQLAAAAGLLTGEADEGQPVILARGLKWPTDAASGRASDMNRPQEQDLYR
ncbi:MAG: coenzyme F420-0:L-glutamate ligase [Chloroflexi bacterium]|nr:coenzyme F420-0:L-glutamate ligase [Chloroflexota bacterium]